MLSIQVPCFIVARAPHFLIQLRARGCIISWLLISVAVSLSVFWVYCVTIMICLIGNQDKGYMGLVFAFFFVRC